MSFLDQQIQSFLHLGACKEYLILAKPKVRETKIRKVPTPLVRMPVAAVHTSGDVPEANSGMPPRRLEPPAVPRKPEIIGVDSGARLVPNDLEEEIRRLAYSLAERRGFEPGHETEDWLEAEREVRERYRQRSA